MTKKFEEIVELKVEDALSCFEKKKLKGEFVVVLDREPA
jgi:16S rRNA C1402 (ribose-2'-O) methylase RsmI